MLFAGCGSIGDQIVFTIQLCEQVLRAVGNKVLPSFKNMFFDRENMIPAIKLPEVMPPSAGKGNVFGIGAAAPALPALAPFVPFSAVW